MGFLVVRSGVFRRTALAKREVGDRIITVKAKKLPFCRRKYEVLVDGKPAANGVIHDVSDSLKKDAGATELLQEVALAMEDKSMTSLNLGKYECFCLDALYRTPKEGLHSYEIARKYGLTTGPVSTVLDRLSQKGWLKRERRETQDRLVLLYSLTEVGTEIAERLANDKLFQEYKMKKLN